MIKNGSNIISVEKSFYDVFKLNLEENEILVDFSAKLSNIFTKVISESEIGLYGDYELYIFYANCIDEVKKEYKVKKICETFSEVIDCNESEEEAKDGKGEKKVVNKASIEFKVKNEGVNTSENLLVYNLCVEGRIHLAYSVVVFRKLDFAEDEEGIINESEIDSRTKVWQYRPTKIRSVEELMNMDLEYLKEENNNKE
ncbi:hypothetical protein [Clostridium manihotivorum]|uniref:Uncharacterized protein n=1 Tax=Clostridium manihotivorum TaxID=2320868 RepID=A0A410DY57_9CLOT|nr:hypothetical protein [Clostridium manihotivorum]QAA33997.1 hypothetical protein C1I91_21540 [Clostridium manihotivorum]